MSMAVIAGVVSVAGTAYGVYSSNQSAKRSRQALDAQGRMVDDSYGIQQEYLDFFKEAIGAFQEQAYALAGESKGEVKRAYNKSIKIIDAIPEVSDLMPEAEKLSRQDFDFRTGIKRENLAFILGDTEKDLRDSQAINTGLAALDSSNFQNRFNSIIKSNLLDLKANTVGDPVGTFANLSAQNLYNFSNQGLSNSLAINDFFAKNGTVDPISPLQTSFDLRTIAEREAAMRVDNERYRANTIADINQGLMSALGQSLGASKSYAGMGIGMEQNRLSDLIGLSNSSLVAQQTRDNQILSAIGGLANTLGRYQSIRTQNNLVDSQIALNNELIRRYTSDMSLTTGASRYSVPTTTSTTYGITASAGAGIGV